MSEFKFGDIVRVGWPSPEYGLTAMVVCSGTNEGIVTSEGIIAMEEDFALLVLGHNEWVRDQHSIWPLDGTSSSSGFPLTKVE